MFQSYKSAACLREIGNGGGTLTGDGTGTANPIPVATRFPQLIGSSVSAAALFATLQAIVVGTGAVGRRIAIHLARIGIGTLGVIDPGRYDERANLVTQEIFTADLGRAKSERTGEVCKQVSPATRVLMYEGRFQDLDPVSLAEADVVFLATDNLAAEVEASYQFRLLGIPLVQASVHGETLVAQVRFLANQRADSPCLVCGYGPSEYEHLNKSSWFRCSGSHSTAGPVEQTQVVPTTSTSYLCALAADLALVQWTRHTLGLGEPVADTLLQYCGFTHRMTQTELVRRDQCRGGHMILDHRTLPGPLAECKWSSLAGLAGFNGRTHQASSLTLDNLSYVTSARCRCQTHPVERFLPGGQNLGTCPICREHITPQPFYTSRPTPGSELHAQRHRRLKELGGAAATWAVVNGNERGVLFTTAKGGSNGSNAHAGERNS